MSRRDSRYRHRRRTLPCLWSVTVAKATHFGIAVEYGYEKTKEIFPVEGTMYRPSQEFSPKWQQNILTQLAAKKEVDTVATTLPHPTMFDEVVKNMEEQGKTC